jgi:chromosome partitioning protein
VLAPGTPTGDAAHVVVDTAANEAAADLEALAQRADVVIVPTPPYALDLAATLATVAALTPYGRVRVLLTRTPPAPQRDALEARAMLEARGVHVLRAEVPARKPYAEAALIGGTVRDVPRGAELWPLWPRLIREVTP